MTEDRLPEPDEQVYAFPLSSAQERMWFLEQLESGTANQIVGAVELYGVLDRDALAQALDGLVQRHETLRTTFRSMEGAPVQVVAEKGTVPFEIRTVATEEQVQAALASEARQPFNLERGPLLRAVLFRLSDRRHVLMVAIHHIVCDGWSLGVFIREMAALYTVALHRVEPQLPALPIQYADYALWQRDWLAGEGLAAQLAYWRKQLQGPLPVLELPADRPRPPVESHRGGRLPFKLSAEMTRELIALGRRENATLFMVLVAAFTALVARYTGQDDVIVGTPVAGRGRPELEGLIGLFLNTLVLRTDITGDPTFVELLRRVRETALNAYANQDVPFERLVEELHPARDPSRNPLFQVMFVLQNPASVPDLPGLAMRPLEVDRGASQFDLTLSMLNFDGNLQGRWEYSTDLFDRATIERMAGHFQTLLAGIVADPDQRLAALPLLADAERAQFAAWNATARPYPKEVLLHELIEAQVARTPDAVALVFEGHEMSYGELSRRAHQLATHLQALGVGPESLVGVCIERSFEMVIGLLGILKAGGAYVPLDPSYPPERLSFMVEDSRAPVLLTQERLLDRLPPHTAHVLVLDRDWGTIERACGAGLRREATAANLAYMIYTSGSTGRPKGALNTHRAICNRLLWMQEEYRLDASDRVLQKTPFSFDVSVWEFFWPLMTGAPLVLARPDGHRDSGYLVRLIQEQRITTLHFVPSMLRVFLEEDGLEQCRSLRRVICSGEALSHEMQDRFFERLDAELHNLYGPTEAAVDVTYWACQKNDGRSTVPIGRPVANTQMYVLDQGLNPVPVGIPGELHIGGVQVGRGYHGRPELTVEKFIPNPFSQEFGTSLYKTGDLARYLPDGAIEYLGRLDHQVKLRGFRIELGEIEATIARHPGVRQVVVVVQDEPPAGKRLVAYVVAEAADRVSSQELREFLKSVLPDHMIPATFVPLDAIPLTPNGKVDRRALANLGLGQHVERREAVPPDGTAEIQIAKIWEEVLGCGPVGVTEDFFALGGHSLLAVRMIARIEQVCGQRLPVRTLFEGGTIRHLVGVLLQQNRKSIRGLLAPIQAGGVRSPFFFLHGDYKGGGFYSRDLARLVGPEQPFYVMHPLGVDGDPVPPTIEAMADEYLQALRAFRPTGPYLLGGYCNGGLIAFEMATRLRAQGEQVDFLVAIDTLPWNARFRGLKLLSKLLATAFRLPEEDQSQLFLQLQTLAIVTERLPRFCRAHPQEALRRVWRRLRGTRPTPPPRDGMDAVYRRAISKYVPRQYPGRLTLFMSAEAAEERVDRDWRRLAEQIEVRLVPGDHTTAITQHVHVVAEHLRTCLEEAQRQDVRGGQAGTNPDATSWKAQNRKEGG